MVIEEPGGIVKREVGVRVVLGPALVPVQNGTPPMLALSRIRVLSFPVW
jgi:hypothetical protein